MPYLPSGFPDGAWLPDVVVELGERFAARGFELSLVGGPVRDLFLGRSSPDLDFTTAATPDQITAAVAGWAEAHWDIGRDFGTIGLRRGAVNTGKWEDDYGAKLFLNLERNGNALGLSGQERDKFIAKAELPVYDGTQEYCLWLGCMGAYDPHGREIIFSLAQVMRYLGVSFGVLRKERSPGALVPAPTGTGRLLMRTLK